MAEHKGILVLGEVVGDGVSPVTQEILSAAVKLAGQTGEDVACLLIGHGLAKAAQEAVAYGASKVLVADAAGLAEYDGDSYTALAEQACREFVPSTILMGHTSMGREVAPRLGCRLEASLATDCVDVYWDGDSGALIQVRPVYGGNALARVASKKGPSVVTIRPRSMAAAAADGARTGTVTDLDIGHLTSRVTTVDTVIEAEVSKIEDARIVVAGGAGISEADDFSLVRELADALAGCVGATRLPCEQGWVPSGCQIGQTGKIVGPDLYIAVGISGAPQHMAGCAGAKCIVAINRDPDAHIFKQADYGIVADYKQALPVLVQKCRELKGA